MKDLQDIETENGIDINSPIVYEFRRMNLESIAEKQGSDLHCPYCKAHLPYTQMTVRKNDYFCTLCQRYFYTLPKPVQLEFKF